MFLKFPQKTLAQKFSCEFCEISISSTFMEHLQVTAFAFNVLGVTFVSITVLNFFIPQLITPFSLSRSGWWFIQKAWSVMERQKTVGTIFDAHIFYMMHENHENHKKLLENLAIYNLIDTGRKLDVHKTDVRSIYVLCLWGNY